MLDESKIIIRKALDKDFTEIKKICALTGNNGEPISQDRFLFFSEYWITPYELFEKNYCFIAEFNSQIIGYITGCANTKLHNFKKKIFFEPILLLKILNKKFPKTQDTKRFLKRFFYLEKPPEKFFLKENIKTIYKNYPAHLHINLLKEFRGKKIGEKLLNALFNELKSQRITGIHLFCGDGPVPFYTKNGFKILETISYKQKINVHLMIQNL